MRKNTNELVELESDNEVEEKLAKAAKRKAGVQKRKNQKKKDKVSRWGGFILLFMVLMVGFVLWVVGEMQ